MKVVTCVFVRVCLFCIKWRFYSVQSRIPFNVQYIWNGDEHHELLQPDRLLESLTDFDEKLERLEEHINSFSEKHGDTGGEDIMGLENRGLGNLFILIL